MVRKHTIERKQQKWMVNMPKYTKFIGVILIILLLNGCSTDKKEEQKIDYNSNFVLTSSDGKQFVFPKQKEFSIDQDMNTGTVSEVELYYKNAVNNVLNLKVFQGTKDYGEEQLIEELNGYVARFQDLVQENAGSIEDSIDATEVKINDYTVHYSSISYNLDNYFTYNAEFFVVINDYIIKGSVRLEEEASEEIELELLLHSLFSNLRLENTKGVS